jgi:hypothetical protein
MKDMVKRTIRVGDYCLGSYCRGHVFCYVTGFTKQMVNTTSGRFKPEFLLVLNDIPIDKRCVFSPFLEDKFKITDIKKNTDQLPMEWEEKKEIENVNKDNSDRVRGDWIVLSPSSGKTD